MRLRDVGCPDCGAIQTNRRFSRRLRGSLARSAARRWSTGAWRSLSAAFACSASVFLLLIPANLLPFLTTSIVGVSRHSRLITSATAMWKDGWPLLAVVIGLFIVGPAADPLRLADRRSWSACGLTAIRPGSERRSGWPTAFSNGRCRTCSCWALWVAYARLSATISVEIGAGAWCFIAAGVISLFARASLDKGATWRRIGPDLALPAGAASSCLSCDLVVPATSEGSPCPRCSAKIASREPDAIARATALTLAGLIFYIPANLYPIATLPINFQPTRYNVLQGVIDLGQAGFFGLALLVFCASFAIPLLKLAGITYCLSSVPATLYAPIGVQDAGL